jgi:hypothetical protein
MDPHPSSTATWRMVFSILVSYQNFGLRKPKFCQRSSHYKVVWASLNPEPLCSARSYNDKSKDHSFLTIILKEWISWPAWDAESCSFVPHQNMEKTYYDMQKLYLYHNCISNRILFWILIACNFSRNLADVEKMLHNYFLDQSTAAARNLQRILARMCRGEVGPSSMAVYSDFAEWSWSNCRGLMSNIYSGNGNAKGDMTDIFVDIVLPAWKTAKNPPLTQYLITVMQNNATQFFKFRKTHNISSYATIDRARLPTDNIAIDASFTSLNWP